MTCNECGEKPKKACGAFPKAVIEIDNPEKIVLLRKVLVPASMGDESTFPPTIGKYHNVLLEYEASGGIYLYSSDGIPTKLSSDVTELQAQLNALRVRVGEEEVARADADTALSNRITSLDNSLATVAKTGSYNDLSNKPTIGNGTLTIKKNGAVAGTFTANATANKNIDISVPTKTSDLANDGSDGASTYVEADELSTVATTGNYNDLTNKPTIPTVNDATLTIQKNGVNVQTFTANSSTNKTANITVPTAVSELTNDSGYATTTQLNNGLATKQDTLTAGDNIQINSNTISATDTTYTAGNAIDITNGEISADIHPADFFTAEGVVSDCGSDLSLDDTMASTLRSVELKGDTFQQAYSGEQLLAVDGMSTPSSNTGFWNTLSNLTKTDLGDGWGHIVGTQASSTSSNFQIKRADGCPLLQPSTLYTIIVEVKDVVSNPTLRLAQPSNASDTWAPYSFSDIIYEETTHIDDTGTLGWDTIADGYYVVKLTTKSTLTNLVLRMWSHLTTSREFSIRISILEGDHSSDWRNYCGENWQPYVNGVASPNPDYPQDIHVVTGEQTVKITGKNLFPTVSQTSSSAGITIARNSDGTYDISGTATSEFNALSWVEDLSAFADGQTYTLSVSEQVGDLLVLVDMYNGNTWLRSFPRPGGTTLSRTAALDLTNATKIKFSLRVQSGKTVNLTNLAVQFEEGTATDYQPYQSQSYEINLGKNLFNKSDASAQLPNTYINTTGVLQSGTDAGTVFVKCQPNATYTVSKSLSARFIIGETATLPADGVAVSNIIRDDTATHLTITTGPTAQYIVVFCHHSSDTMTLAEIASTVQIEAGSTATSYAPYFTPIELCKIGDYQDYIYKNGDDWYLRKETGKVVLDGSETWSAANMTNNWMYYTTNAGMATVTSSQVPNIASNYFSVTTTDGQWTSVAGSKSVTLNNTASPNTQIRFTVGDSTNKLADFKTWLSTHSTTVYYALATPDNILIENPVLVAQLNALAKAKSYNDQTNIIVTTAGNNLPATLCVEAYRKSLGGVIEAIDSACTCRQNLVVYLPNGMTTYTNNDAPIPIPEVMEALKRGQSVFLVDGGLSESIYVVTAANMDDGTYSMRADQTGINPRRSDGHWNISGDGGNVWDSVTFINDATPLKYTPNIFEKTWFAFTSSTPLLDQYRRTYYPASSDMTFNNTQENLSVAELWEKLASSEWNGNPVILEVPLQEISTRTTSLVDNGYSAENPLLTISVSLGPDNYFERETSEYTITGWAAECTPITFGGKESYTVGVVRVVGDGSTDYRFVVSLTEVNSIN